MRCSDSECKANNRIAIGFCLNCMEKRITPSWNGHPDQSFGHMSYSQTGEDILVCNIFEHLLGIANPSYLDLGAHHPINMSNTYLMYKRGSRGVVVEANPHLIPEFSKDRSEDLIICSAVIPEPSKDLHTLYMYDSHSGRNSLIQGYMTNDPYGSLPQREETKVIGYTINEIVTSFCDMKFPDFLSVDIEGLDLAVLESADFKSLGYPRVICAEVIPYQNPENIYECLDPKGYVPLIRLSYNVIFVKKEDYGRCSR